MSDWVQRYFDDVDSMQMEPFLAWHTPEIRVRFANNPEAVGQEQVRSAIGQFWDAIGGLKHNIVNVWETPDHSAVVESMIDYTRKDGRVVTIPCTTILHRDGDKVDSLRIYLDGTPIFAPADTLAAT